MKREWIFAGLLGAILLAELCLLLAKPATPAPGTGRHSSIEGGREAVPTRRQQPGLTRADADRVLLGDIAKVPFQELFGLLAHRSPAAIARLAAQLQALPRNSNSEARIANFYKVWAILDPQAALNSALAMNDRRFARRALFAVTSNTDPSAAGILVKMISQLPSDRLSDTDKNDLLSTAIGRWAQANPMAAAGFIDTMGAKGIAFFNAFNSTAYNWAAQDPAAALAWAQTHDDNHGHLALQGALNGWWQVDPTAAEAYVANHPLIDRGEMAMSFANMLFQRDREHARQWVLHLPNETARQAGINSLAQMWATTDPSTAASWLSGLPAGDIGGSLGTVVHIWAQQDSGAASAFLNSLGGTAHDQAVAAYSGAVSDEQPSLALTWAATIGDLGRRQQTEAQVAADWLKRDPAGAKSWIENSSLPAAEKAQLLSPAPTP